MKARYVHTNLVARDWKRLAEFYCEVFGCRPKPPERDLAGPWLDSATGLAGAHLRGIHLYLPGYEADGPTLEIFQYTETGPEPRKAANTPGFGHIAFSVDDVDHCLEKVLLHGGGTLGEVVKTEVPGLGGLHFVYAKDPDGNIIEIQRWD